MRKSLVLAMAMTMGVTASAYAANPFSDVPAGHWAYDSVVKLADAGLIESYVDDSFGGDKLVTRYEMAQLVARALANGANVDALAAEFSDELVALGVRVENLEKKADNVKITGEIRARYVDQEADANYDSSKNSDEGNVSDLRTRLWINGQINDNWNYVGMLENVQDFDDNSGNNDTDLKRAYVVGRLGGVDVTAGKYNIFLGDGLVFDYDVEGAEITYGDKVQLSLFGGQPVDYDQDYFAIEGKTNFGVVDLFGGYTFFKTNGSESEQQIYYVQLGTDLGKNLNLKATYLNGDNDDAEGLKDDGYVVELAYKGVNQNDVGSWGLTANYWDQGAQTYAEHTTDANTFDNGGFKGFGIALDYAVAKNIVTSIAYYDTECELCKYYGDDTTDQRLWTSVQFYF